MSAAELPPIESLIPHRGTEARVVVGSRNCLAKTDGTIAPWVALEYMSQCAAAHESLLAADGRGSHTPGYLTAAVGVRLHRSHFEAGEQLRVRTRRTRGRLGLGVFSHFCTIHQENEAWKGSLLAEGRLTISIPKAVRTR